MKMHCRFDRMKQGLASLALGLGLLSGCSSVSPLPQVEDVPKAKADQAWARVLKQHVDAEGRVAFRAIGKNPADLKTYVRFVAKAKLEMFTTPAEELAFYLNAYNALSMYNVIERDYPKDLDGTFKRAGFFYFKKFTILGKEMSLYSFENEMVRTKGDPRVHVALNCMSAGCPRLPREPFEGTKLEAQLEREALKFYNEERNVRTDAAKKTVYISEILDFFTKDFLAKEPTLIKYVNKYRKTKVPDDYEVEFIPYDWTIYRQPNDQ